MSLQCRVTAASTHSTCRVTGASIKLCRVNASSRPRQNLFMPRHCRVTGASIKLCRVTAAS
ncbi:hypothetical protein P692DRAFT_201796724, partial [Suillus brevipes Sb2]